MLQDLSDGRTYLEEVAIPSAKLGHVLIQNTQSLISLGTEKMLMNFGKANLLQKARQQPDKVKQVLAKVKTDGLLQTVDAVRAKLNQPLPLGYSAAGVVIDPADTGFKKGDRVISNGHHAQVVRVPKNLCAKIPDNVTDEEAAFTVVSAIGLQGVRILNPTLGEKVVVIGLGLIGLITTQILRANGCQVLGFDFSEDKVNLAKKLGFDAVKVEEGVDVVAQAMSFSAGIGVDGVIITASTASNNPVSQAANISRKRGKIVLVGVVGLQLSRDEFYEKELTFQVSCSYGPGRYDESYEQQGRDYPIGFVRWTEQRNFEAVLDLMASGALDVKPLISHKYEFLDSEAAYKQIAEQDALGVLLQYPDIKVDYKAHVTSFGSTPKYSNQDVVCNFLGAGNYAGRVLIPAFKQAGAKLDTLVSSGGLSSTHFGKKFEFAKSATNESEAFNTETANTLVIATQHKLHANQVCKALEKNKHVFVEKPLALTIDELESLEKQVGENNRVCLTVGFNRRFSPHVVKIKSLLDKKSAPKNIVMTVNAGFIPADHWTQNQEVGGGRIIGEVCHFIDLLRFLVGHSITSVEAKKMDDECNDNATITMTYADGSLGTVHYFSNGAISYPKERLEVFCQGGILQLDNFRKLRGFNWSGFSIMNLWRQDKGQQQCVNAFIQAIQSGAEVPIPYNEIFEVSRVTIQAANILNQRT